MDAPAGFGAADQCPFGDRMRQLAAQFLRCGLVGQLINQPMLDCGQLAGAPAHNAQRRQQLPGRQRVKAQSAQPIQASVKRVK
jgi:hypothetical protein